MARNEKTSKTVASKAGKYLARSEYRIEDIDTTIRELESTVGLLKCLRKDTEDARSIAGSCLTQAADKPK